MSKKLEEYTVEEITSQIKSNLDSVVIIDAEADTYRALVRKGIFADLFEETGSYVALTQKLWFHLNNDEKKTSPKIIRSSFPPSENSPENTARGSMSS